MHPRESKSPWQLSPVTPLGYVVAGSLVALAVDAVLLWRALPHAGLSLLTVAVPLLIAIRVIRGFPNWIPSAGVLLTAVGALAVYSASRAPHTAPPLTFVVAAVLSAAGLVATVGAGIERRIAWPPTTLAALTSGQWQAVAAPNAVKQ